MHKEKLSFRELLLNHHGPSLSKSEQNNIWRYLQDHEKEVIFFLDGYDESKGLDVDNDSQSNIVFTSTDQPHYPRILLHNLISGNIFNTAKVLLTTRPHCVDELKDCAFRLRLVNIESLDDGKKEIMVRKDLENLPILCESVVSYLKENEMVGSLCSVPINVRNFLDYVKWIHQGMGDTHLNKEKMPQNMAALLFALDIKMLQALDRGINQKSSPEKVLEKRRMLLQNLATLAFSGVEHNLKQIFSEDELAECGLEAGDVEKSIMTCSMISVRGLFGMETRAFFGFTHLAQQEHLAGLYLTQVNRQTSNCHNSVISRLLL